MRKTTIDYDKHGHCVWCHKDMIMHKAIDGREQTVFSPDYDEMEYVLNDGSRMRVATCRSCKHELQTSATEADVKEVMNVVKRGWRREVELLVKGVKNPITKKRLKWSKERADKYLNEYDKKEILFDSSNKSSLEVEEEVKRKKNKVGK